MTAQAPSPFQVGFFTQLAGDRRHLVTEFRQDRHSQTADTPCRTGHSHRSGIRGHSALNHFTDMTARAVNPAVPYIMLSLRLKSRRQFERPRLTERG